MTADPTMRIDVLTIFPEYLDPFRHALLGKAIENGILQVGVHNLRQWTHDVHQAVDSTPCGGGMVMKPEVWVQRSMMSPREPTSSRGSGSRKCYAS